MSEITADPKTLAENSRRSISKLKDERTRTKSWFESLDAVIGVEQSRALMRRGVLLAVRTLASEWRESNTYYQRPDSDSSDDLIEAAEGALAKRAMRQEEILKGIAELADRAIAIDQEQFSEIEQIHAAVKTVVNSWQPLNADGFSPFA